MIKVQRGWCKYIFECFVRIWVDSVLLMYCIHISHFWFLILLFSVVIFFFISIFAFGFKLINLFNLLFFHQFYFSPFNSSFVFFLIFRVLFYLLFSFPFISSSPFSSKPLFPYFLLLPRVLLLSLDPIFLILYTAVLSVLSSNVPSFYCAIYRALADLYSETLEII